MNAAVQAKHHTDGAGPGSAPSTGRQFWRLSCAYHVGPDATAGDLVSDAHSLVSSAVAVLSLMELSTDEADAVFHLMKQANGLLSLANTMPDWPDFAAQSTAGGSHG